MEFQFSIDEQPKCFIGHFQPIGMKAICGVHFQSIDDTSRCIAYVNPIILCNQRGGQVVGANVQQRQPGDG